MQPSIRVIKNSKVTLAFNRDYGEMAVEGSEYSSNETRL